MNSSEWLKPGEDWPMPKDPTRIEARLKDGSTHLGYIFWDITEEGDSVFSFEIDGGTFGDTRQVIEYRPCE